MDEKMLLDAMRTIIQEENKPILSRLDAIEENIEILKEEAAITRHTANLVLK